jgi:Ca2+-binding RTX toxin-like protein
MPITGTEAGETIDGTSGADEIFGLGGNDTINALEGNDTIYGGLGNDTMNGGDGDDLFVEDEVTSFNDVFNGGAGTDTLELRVLANPVVGAAGLVSGHAMTNVNSLVSIERLVFASQSGSILQGVILESAVASSGLTEVVAGAGRDFLVYIANSAATSFTVPTLTYTGFSPAIANAWDVSEDLVIYLSTAASGASVTLNAASGLNLTQLLIGGNSDNTLNGSANGDILDGAGGINQLNGNGGNDALAIVNQYSPNGAGGFFAATTYNGFGSTLDGGSGTDALLIGGIVDLQATLVSIEGVHLQSGFNPPVANTAKQDAAYLVLDGAHIAMLPTTPFFSGTGTVEFDPNDGASLNLSTYVLSPGNAIQFRVFAGDGNGLTFTGSANGDEIQLGIGNQTAHGGGGADRIVFGAGNQVATGGAGADLFEIGIGSGAVTDFVIGEDKIDFLDTGITNEGRLGDLNFVQNGANSVISADSGGEHFEIVLQNTQLANLSISDVILDPGGFANFDTGTEFADFLFGHQFNDNLTGAGGNDRLYGGGGVDVLSGGDGDDVIILDGAIGFGGTFDGGAGTDTLLLRSYAQSSSYGIFGTVSGLEILRFDSQPGETIFGIIAMPAFASGLTTVGGGDGNDTFVLVAVAQGSYSLSWVNLVDWTGDDALVLTTNPNLTANVTLNARSDVGNQALIGAQGNDTLVGSGFSDFLRGGGGNDAIDGGAGADQMIGDFGDDVFYANTQADLVFEDSGAGHDTIIATTGFYLYENIEDLGLAAGSGAVFGVGNGLNNLIQGNETANLLLGGAGNDFVNGADGNDVLYGEDGDDTVSGDGGIDFVAGGLGNDDLFGNAGADALFGEDGDDYLDGGDSFDTDILIGGAGNDTLYAISGQADPEQDLLDGGAGDDAYWVDTGADLTFEAADGGTDTVHANVTVANAGVYLYANVENLVLEGTTAFGVGNELANSMIGSDSNNWLLGGAGNDRIAAGGGNDVLFGEVGADTFVFGVNEGADLIGDFAAAEDVIEFAGIFTSYAQVQANMVEVGTDMAIDLGGGHLVVLLGTQIEDLTAANFVFG